MFVVGLIKVEKNQIVIWMCKIMIPQNLHSRFMFKIMFTFLTDASYYTNLLI